MTTPIVTNPLRQAQLKMLEMLKAVDTICQKHGLEYWLEGGTLLGAIRQQGFIAWDDDLDISMPRASLDAFLTLAPDELPDTMFLQHRKTDKGYFNLSVPLKIRYHNSRYLEKRERGDESYHQGIYIDIFAYDKKPDHPLPRKLYTFAAKKLLRLLFHKYSTRHLYPGHHPLLYQTAARCFSKAWLEKGLSTIIKKANNSASTYLGYGYDCTNMTYHPMNAYYPLRRALFEGHWFNIPNNPELLLTHQFGDYTTPPPEHLRVMKHCRELVP